ncbi:MAG: hypothetical protein CFE21_14595 [Bacteroidetes bacterium B1(2017)]|nr:MAG: hypothetical protein CFE21_14595 [Bacteroidetes bacterium B1(2017)]
MQRKVHVEKLAQFSGHTGNIYGLYCSPVSGKVYTGASDGYVVEWDLTKPDEGRLICRLNEPIYSIYLFEPKQQLWIGVASGNIHVVDLITKEELKNISVHRSGVFDLKGRDGKILAAGGDGSVSIFNASDYSLEKCRNFSDKSARILAFHPHKDIVAVGFSDCSILFLNEKLEVLDAKMDAHGNSVFSLAYTPDGQYLLSGGRDAMLKIWKVTEGVSLFQEIPAHNLHVHSLSVQKEGSMFLSSSMDKTIKIWDLEGFSLLKVIDKQRNNSHVNSVNKIVWVNESDFVSISDDKLVMHWRVIS